MGRDRTTTVVMIVALLVAQLIFRRSSTSRHVTLLDEYPLAPVGQLQVTTSQVLMKCWFAGMELAHSDHHDAKKGGEKL
jgi:hypothetical protein